MYDLEPLPPKLKTYQEAVSAIEDVQTFLDSKGHNELATKLGSQINSIVSLQFSSAKCSVQTRIDDFLIAYAPLKLKLKFEHLKPKTPLQRPPPYNGQNVIPQMVAAIEGFHCR